MNGKIIVSVVVIAASGIARAWIKKEPITSIVIGSYVFLLVLSIMDLFGNGMSQLAGALAMLAVTYVLITEFPWSEVIALVQGKKVGA